MVFFSLYKNYNNYVIVVVVVLTLTYGDNTETETEETALYPQEKRLDENKRCLNRNRKREGREEKNTDKSTSATQERRRPHARGIRILQACKESGGGVHQDEITE